jgi:hypothetical protein
VEQPKLAAVTPATKPTPTPAATSTAPRGAAIESLGVREPAAPLAPKPPLPANAATAEAAIEAVEAAPVVLPEPPSATAPSASPTPARGGAQ